jgi:hypothetical protein
VVKVEVLPVQMSMRDPDVSRAAIFLISKLSYFSLSIEKANAIEIARGIPSGMDTISRTTAIWML